MIPVNRLVLKHDVGDDAEYHERDAFLYDFQLHKGKRTAIACISHAVGGHLATIFKESDCPRKGNHADKRPIGTGTRLLHTKMSIPCQCHEHVAQQEQQYCVYTTHNYLGFKNYAKVHIIFECAKKISPFPPSSMS